MTEHDRIRRDRALACNRDDLASLGDALRGLQSTDDPSLVPLYDELMTRYNELSTAKKIIHAPVGSTSTRAQHLVWCKKRALEYCDMGETSQAWASMVSDMRKDPATENHPALELGTILLLGGLNSTPMEMRKFIEGFN
jgi:hypothetical protein